jgi:hypothetical protein
MNPAMMAPMKAVKVVKAFIMASMCQPLHSQTKEATAINKG